MSRIYFFIFDAIRIRHIMWAEASISGKIIKSRKYPRGIRYVT